MEIQTFSPLQAEMLILLGNIEQYAEQGRHLSSGPQSHCLFCRVATYLWQPLGTLNPSQNCQKFIASLPEIAASRLHPEDAATCQRAAITPLSRIAKPKLPRQLPIVSSRKIATTTGLSAKNSRWTLAVT